MYYGDFEAYTKDILDRLKENEKFFILKIIKSCKKTIKYQSKYKAYLLVNFSNKKIFKYM